MSLYQSEAEMELVVRAFESCETDKSAFKHRDHLTVAVWYLQNCETSEAIDKMRFSLLRFLDHHHVDRQKYHETITVFWIEMIARELNEMIGASLLEKCNRVIELLNNADLPNEYYSRELLWSAEARSAFVSPDLKAWRSP